MSSSALHCSPPLCYGLDDQTPVSPQIAALWVAECVPCKASCPSICMNSDTRLKKVRTKEITHWATAVKLHILSCSPGFPEKTTTPPVETLGLFMALFKSVDSVHLGIGMYKI